MNCPTCGAPNDADARFCAECGTPLDGPEDIDATMAGHVFRPAEDDMTILSRPEDLIAQEKTLAVDQAQIADVLSGAESEEPTEPPMPKLPEAVIPSEVEDAADVSEIAPPAAGGGRDKRKTWMIIGGVVLLLVILCCCCSVVIGAALGDPDVQREIEGIFSSLPLQNLVI